FKAMLQSLREHAQGWIAGVIATIICLAFALWGIEYYLTSSNNNQTIAKVNGESITQQDLDYASKRLALQEVSAPNAETDISKQQKEKALKELIDTYTLADAAEQQGLVLDNNQIGNVVAQLPIFQTNGKFSLPLFQQFVSRMFPSEQAFFLD